MAAGFGRSWPTPPTSQCSTATMCARPRPFSWLLCRRVAEHARCAARSGAARSLQCARSSPQVGEPESWRVCWQVEGTACTEEHGEWNLSRLPLSSNSLLSLLPDLVPASRWLLLVCSAPLLCHRRASRGRP
eukprot:619146-Rhodomonas_salina.2